MKLIEREPRGHQAHARGRGARPSHRAVMAQLADAQELTESRPARGRLRIGSFATAAGTIVPLAVAAFRPLRPAIGSTSR